LLRYDPYSAFCNSALDFLYRFKVVTSINLLNLTSIHSFLERITESLFSGVSEVFNSTYHLSHPDICQEVLRWYNLSQNGGANTSFRQPLELIHSRGFRFLIYSKNAKPRLKMIHRFYDLFFNFCKKTIPDYSWGFQIGSATPTPIGLIILCKMSVRIPILVYNICVEDNKSALLN